MDMLLNVTDLESPRVPYPRHRPVWDGQAYAHMAISTIDLARSLRESATELHAILDRWEGK